MSSNPEIKSPESEQQSKNNTKDYFEYRLENAEELLKEAEAELAGETDIEKIKRLKEEIADKAIPAIKKYKEILAGLELGNTEPAKVEAKSRLESVKSKIRLIEQDNPRAKLEWMRKNIDGYGDLADDYDFIVGVLTELGVSTPSGEKITRPIKSEIVKPAKPGLSGYEKVKEQIIKDREARAAATKPVENPTAKPTTPPSIEAGTPPAAEIPPYGTLAKKGKAIPPTETSTETPESEAEITETEGPRLKYLEETVKRLTPEIRVETIEIKPELIKIIDGFLAQDMDEGSRMFALAWFEDHKAEIQKMVEEKGEKMHDADEWKIMTVWRMRDKKGKSKAEKDIMAEKYKKFGNELQRIDDLRDGMEKKPMPPDLPLLLLHYLEESIAGEKRKIEASKSQAEIDAIKKQLQELFVVRKEIAAKILGKDLIKMAEEKIAGEFAAETKEQQIEARKKELEEKGSARLLSAEWTEFWLVPSEKRRTEILKSIGWDKIDKRGAFLILNNEADKKKFSLFLLASAEEKGIGEQAFYGLLDQGYKPYQARKKWFGKKMFFWHEMPHKTGPAYSNEETEEKLVDFAKKAGEDYEKKFSEQADQEWESEYGEKIRVEIERRISELAQSLETAAGGVQGAYGRLHRSLEAEK